MAKTNRIVIKKYSNRRLYDTERSLYINLEEVAVLLRAGRDVEVQDAKTGHDLTRTILLQLVLEREKNNIETLPVELLKELIVIQDTPARKWFDLSMKYSLELLRRFKKGGAGLASPWDIALFNPADVFSSFMRDMRIPGFGMGSEAGRQAPGSDWGPSAPPPEDPSREPVNRSPRDQPNRELDDRSPRDQPNRELDDRSPDLKSELDALRAKLESIEASMGRDDDA